jgi:hypothetical protein
MRIDSTTLVIARLNAVSHLEKQQTEEELAVVSQPIQDLLKMCRNELADEGIPFDHIPEYGCKTVHEYWLQYGLGQWGKKGLSRINKWRDDEAFDTVKQIKTLAEILRIKVPENQWSDLKRKFLYLGLTGQLIKQMKYSVNVLFNRYTQTEEPSFKPGLMGLFIFPRNLRLFFRRVIVQGRSHGTLKMKSLVLVYSFFQGLKKGLLPIRPDQIDQSLIDHKTALTRSVDVPSDVLDFMSKTLEEEFSDIPKKVVSAFFRNQPQMSTKSTCESTLQLEGQVGLARSLFCAPDYRILELKEEVSIDFDTDFDLAALSLMDEFFLLGPEEFLGFSSYAHREGIIELRGNSFISEFEIREQLYFFRRYCSPPLFGNRVKPAVVLEPMKGRIITKPSVGSYIDYNGIQQTLWRELSKRSQFRLISRPVEDLDIWYLCEDFSLGEGWNSGDYSGATDNLASEVSRLILSFFLSGSRKRITIPLEDQVRILDSFTGSNISYTSIPVKYGKQDPQASYKFKCVEQGVVEQKNGQLMGHVLSFPILCVANYLMFLYTFKSRGWKVPRVLVNGDDILFHCRPDQYLAWSADVRLIGFFPSVGKNLFQSDICQINSVLFRTTWKIDMFSIYCREIKEVPYLNMGIVTGRGKGKSSQAESGKLLELNVPDAEKQFPVLPTLLRSLRSKFWDNDVAFRCFKENHSDLVGILRSLAMEDCCENDLYFQESLTSTADFGLLILSRTFSCYKNVLEIHRLFRPGFIKRRFDRNPLLLNRLEFDSRLEEELNETRPFPRY